MPPSLIIENFDILMKKLRLLCNVNKEKSKFSNNSLILKHNFNSSEDELEKVFLLLHNVCSEAYERSFNVRSLTSFYIPIPNYIR